MVDTKDVTPEAFAEATWDEILPYYEELAVRPLDAASHAQDRRNPRD